MGPGSATPLVWSELSLIVVTKDLCDRLGSEVDASGKAAIHYLDLQITSKLSTNV